MAIFCRKEEQKILNSFLTSNKAEFLAICGRRRIGKTFLIHEFFQSKKTVIFFNTTGVRGGYLFGQIKHFTKTIGDVFYNGAKLKEEGSWDSVFELLTEAINIVPKNKKVVLFFDEFPWMVTRKSKLLQNLEYYWNQHWSNDKRIKLIICGSSASWIIEKIINNKAGLHNRITRKIFLDPLDLHETKTFLLGQKINLTNLEIMKIYMVTGGVPYYLTHVEKGLSATQIIQQLAFNKKGILIDEFGNLFSSLFNYYEVCIDIIRLIANHRYGIGQKELFAKLEGKFKGKTGITKLKELEQAGFIINFIPFQHKQKGVYYKVIDEYTLFYLRWIEPIQANLIKSSLSHGYWDKQQNTAAWHSWAGLAFEAICYKHIQQIRKSLNLSPTAMPSTWRYIPHKGAAEKGAQIDLLFDRDDNAITICEIKNSVNPFMIDKQYASNLVNKVDIFKKITKTTKQILIAMISASGLKKTIYSEEFVSSLVRLDDLFKEVD
jgi:uncharacterized protein